jgi:hypothetical protein
LGERYLMNVAGRPACAHAAISVPDRTYAAGSPLTGHNSLIEVTRVPLTNDAPSRTSMSIAPKALRQT